MSYINIYSSCIINATKVVKLMQKIIILKLMELCINKK